MNNAKMNRNFSKTISKRLKKIKAKQFVIIENYLYLRDGGKKYYFIPLSTINKQIPKLSQTKKTFQIFNIRNYVIDKTKTLVEYSLN
ncbi:hypothetical protein ACFLZV_00630 [Candidatus Margulisiibacteriota bacterium]